MTRQKSAQKVLVIKLRAMGDTVITTASLNALREALPQGSEIHALLPEMWAPLLEGHRSVAKVWSWPHEKGRSRLNRWREFWAMVGRLRREKYHMVFALHAGGTGAWLSRLSGAPQRYNHFHGIHHRNRFSTAEIPGKGEIKPAIERDLDALRAAGLEILTKDSSIDPTESARSWASDFFAEVGLTQPLLVLGLAASRPTKIWPIENYRELAKKWVSEMKGSVLLLLGPGEEHLASELVKEKGVFLRAGGDLMQNAALIEKAQLFIGNDSGPKHLAVALGVKTITLFGPENPLEWHPYSREEHPILFVENLPCRKSLGPGLPEWCSVRECVVEKHRCMREITVSQVEALWQG